MQVKDLNIEKEILPFFDFTWNEDARIKVKKFILIPLNTKDAIITRQKIVKGFLTNISLYKSYSYSRIDYREVSQFMSGYTDKEYLPKRLSTLLLLNKKRYYLYRSRCVQVILLYHRLHNLYIKNLTIAAFPETYKDDIRKLDDFFNFLRLDYFEALIRSGGFKIKAIVAFIKLVSVHYNEGRIKVFDDAYTTFEAYISISLGTYKNKFTFPDITDNVLHLKDFYHPLLKEPVKNCFNPETNVTLLTGPNMSGKSTLLKALGICVYLANAGFPVPAAEAAIPKYDSIFVFINLNDDLQSGYSHFMTEIINLKQVVTTAKSSRCFAVFDELFRGTNIEDAFEISETTLKGLLNYKNSMFLVSSHLHQLVTIPQITGGQIACHYLDCSLKDNNPAFTYQLKEGWTDIKIGKVLFEKEGLNKILAAK